MSLPIDDDNNNSNNNNRQYIATISLRPPTNNCLYQHLLLSNFATPSATTGNRRRDDVVSDSSRGSGGLSTPVFLTPSGTTFESTSSNTDDVSHNDKTNVDHTGAVVGSNAHDNINTTTNDNSNANTAAAMDAATGLQLAGASWGSDSKKNDDQCDKQRPRGRQEATRQQSNIVNNDMGNDDCRATAPSPSGVEVPKLMLLLLLLLLHRLSTTLASIFLTTTTTTSSTSTSPFSSTVAVVNSTVKLNDVAVFAAATMGTPFGGVNFFQRIHYYDVFVNNVLLPTTTTVVIVIPGGDANTQSTLSTKGPLVVADGMLDNEVMDSHNFQASLSNNRHQHRRVRREGVGVVFD